MSLLRDDQPIRLSEPGRWTLSIPEICPSANVLRHWHWAKYAKLMETLYYRLRAADGFLDVSRPTGKRWVIIVRHSRGRLDRDNLYSSAKPLVDILKPPRTESGTYRSGAKAGQQWVRMRIGHGLILEDDEDHLDLTVLNDTLRKGQKPFTTITISDEMV